MPTGKDQRTRDAYELMARMGGAFHRARRKIPKSLENAFEEGTLGSRHISVINVLVSNGALSVSELAGRLELSLSATSQLVSELSNAEFIEREEDANDRRKTIVTMSRTHGKEITAYVQFRARPLLRVLAKISEKEGGLVLRCIQDLLDEMSREGA